MIKRLIGLNCIASYKHISEAQTQRYGVSLAIWDHTVLPATHTSERTPP